MRLDDLQVWSVEVPDEPDVPLEPDEPEEPVDPEEPEEPVEPVEPVEPPPVFPSLHAKSNDEVVTRATTRSDGFMSGSLSWPRQSFAGFAAKTGLVARCRKKRR